MSNKLKYKGLFDLDISVLADKIGKEEFYAIHKKISKIVSLSSPNNHIGRYVRVYKDTTFLIRTRDEAFAKEMYSLKDYVKFNVIKKIGNKDIYVLELPLPYHDYETFRSTLKNYNHQQNALQQLLISRKNFFTDPMDKVIDFYGLVKFLEYMHSIKKIIDNSSKTKSKDKAFLLREDEDSIVLITKDRKRKKDFEQLGSVSKIWMNKVTSTFYIKFYTNVENFNKRVEEAEYYIQKSYNLN
jgi:hypothetical protein